MLTDCSKTWKLDAEILSFVPGAGACWAHSPLGAHTASTRGLTAKQTLFCFSPLLLKVKTFISFFLLVKTGTNIGLS